MVCLQSAAAITSAHLFSPENMQAVLRICEVTYPHTCELTAGSKYLPEDHGLYSSPFLFKAIHISGNTLYML
jgi:hypothetical protein